MLNSQKIALAAHLHVLLRRKTGRITDTEWMAKDAAYASEIIRFARSSADQDGHTDLAEWADKLEAAMFGTKPAVAVNKPVPRPAAVPEFTDSVQEEAPGVSGTALRYVRGIR